MLAMTVRGGICLQSLTLHDLLAMTDQGINDLLAMTVRGGICLQNEFIEEQHLAVKELTSPILGAGSRPASAGSFRVILFYKDVRCRSKEMNCD